MSNFFYLFTEGWPGKEAKVGFHIPNLQQSCNTKGIATVSLNLSPVGWGKIDNYHSVTTKLEKNEVGIVNIEKKNKSIHFTISCQNPQATTTGFNLEAETGASLELKSMYRGRRDCCGVCSGFLVVFFFPLKKQGATTRQLFWICE